MKMDECKEESLKHLPKSLIKRHVELQQQLDKQKEEKLEMGTTQQQVTFFLDAFGKKTCEISDTMELLNKGLIDKENLAECFDKISKELHNLNRFLSTSTSYLRVYDIRKCKQTLEELQVKCQELEDNLLPKKKFGFKAKKHKLFNQNNVEKKCSDDVDGELMKNSRWKDKIKFNNCGFYNRSGEFLKLNASDVSGKDIELTQLQDCTVVLFGSPSTLHITNTNKCKILSGPVSTSVFIDNCNDCTFVFPCQQLRVHTTRNSSFYIHVTSRAIIEDSNLVQFAPFNWNYEGIAEHFKQAGLDTSVNNWNLVDDFNWLALNVPSPNWKIIDPSDRILDWNLTLPDAKN